MAKVSTIAARDRPQADSERLQPLERALMAPLNVKVGLWRGVAGVWRVRVVACLKGRSPESGRSRWIVASFPITLPGLPLHAVSGRSACACRRRSRDIVSVRAPLFRLCAAPHRVQGAYHQPFGGLATRNHRAVRAAPPVCPPRPAIPARRLSGVCTAVNRGPSARRIAGRFSGGLRLRARYATVIRATCRASPASASVVDISRKVVTGNPLDGYCRRSCC